VSPRSIQFALILLALAGCAGLPDAPAGGEGVATAPARAAAPAAGENAAAAPTKAAPPVATSGTAAVTSRPASPTGATAPGTPPNLAPAAGATRPFADVIKDAAEHAGLFRMYQKDDKIWLEIAPEQLDQPYFFSINLSSGIGEQWLFGGLMWDSDLIAFRKVGQQIQLVALNTLYFANGKSESLAVREAFSDSLLASAPIASQPHPDRKSILVEANALLLTDIPGGNGYLERTFRQSYTFDARNSSITKTRSTPDLAAFNVSAHYALARVSQPPVTPGSVPFTAPPSTVPDIRSLFLGYYYNFSRLPAEAMRPRLADDRIGYFGTWRFDYSNENKVTPRVNYVQRWRLEKKDPGAELSEPRQPIVFWLDRDIPERYRKTIIDGVLEWNKAFERIGFRNAVDAKVQPADADFDTLDARHASIRWMISARPVFGGIGPRQVDPRTGEILDADIGIDPVRLRQKRIQRVEQIPPPIGPFGNKAAMYACQVADYAELELGFALDLLEARGEIEPDSPEAEQFVLDDLKEIVMHEVGHALGLRHNFRASTVYTQAQLNDPEFTKKNGTVGSVMEYNATNIALPGERQGSYANTTLGPYDYWAIEYGYREIPAGEEAQELQRIAGRSNEPLLAFATDEESTAAIDPDSTQGDLSNDPLEFVTRRYALARELLERWQTRPLKPGENYAVLRRSITRALGQVGASSQIAARYVGGVSIVRDHAGSPRPPLYPIDAGRQRAALKLLAKGLFEFDSFKFKPEFMQRLTVDWLDRGDSFDVGLSTGGFDYSLPTQVLAIQRTTLNVLMSDAVAQRVLDSQAKLADPAKGFRLPELYGTLHASIWSELRTGRDIDPFRRNLQREHANRVASALLRPAGSMPADARALLRADAKALRGEIAAAQAKPGYSLEAKAHLAETLSTLDEALKAPLVRQGV
jgi:hypothetical protein